MSDRNVPFADVADEPLYNIKAVSLATGIESVTLRAWERRYGVPEPNRSEQGYRLYSERDIALLRWLQLRIDEGLTIRRAIALLHSQLPQTDTLLPAPQVASDSGASLETLVETLLDAAQTFDARKAQQAIVQTFALFPVEDACIHVLLPVLAHIGERWRLGQTSLQAEHLMTNLIRQHLLALGASMPPPTRAGRAVLGCVEGDWHEMGILMLSLFLRRQGWDVIYLGQTVGTSHLAQALDSIRPDVVLLSANTFDTIVHLPEAYRVVRQASQPGIRFAFGGTLFPHVPGLSDRIPGFYAGDTLLDGLRQVSGLLSGSRLPAPNDPPDLGIATEAAYRAVAGAVDDLASGLASLLSEADPALSGEEVGTIAIETVSALRAALAFDLPQLLSTPAAVGGRPLTSCEVTQLQIETLAAQMCGSEHMPIMKAYLARLQDS